MRRHLRHAVSLVLFGVALSLAACGGAAPETSSGGSFVGIVPSDPVPIPPAAPPAPPPPPAPPAPLPEPTDPVELPLPVPSPIPVPVPPFHPPVLPPLGSQGVRGLTYDATTDQLVATDILLGAIARIGLPFGGTVQMSALPLSILQVDAIAYVAPDTYMVASIGLLYRLQGGVETLIGPLGSADIRSLAFCLADQQLYGVDLSTNELVRIGMVDASMQVVGSPLVHEQIEGLAYEVTTGRLLAVDRDAGELLEIDPLTANEIVRGAITLPVAVFDVAYDTSRLVLWVVEPLSGNVHQVDPLTGAFLP